jgi:hypothetical protein
MRLPPLVLVQDASPDGRTEQDAGTSVSHPLTTVAQVR